MTLAAALAIALAAVAALLVLLVLVLLNQRQTAARLEALDAARAADRSPILLQQQIEGLRDQFGRALDANTHALSTFLRYHHEQGLSKRLLTPKELFAPESLEAFKI